MQEYLPAVYSNAPLDKRFRLEKATQSREHTIVDLGEDEFTVGRLHPMMDNDLRLQRLAQEAADPAWASSCWTWCSATAPIPTPRRSSRPALPRPSPRPTPESAT
ncbi:MAG: hypothetical protein R2854_17640 [Caldilineaceae bacterium]